MSDLSGQQPSSPSLPGRFSRFAQVLPRAARIAAAAAVVALVAAGLAVLTLANGEREVTAIFPQAVGVFPGDDVRMLGVKVGSIDTVEPTGDKVRVTMSYDASQPLPPNATAAVVTPTLVSIRYIQLGPQWSQGPQLADRATIPESRTAAPVEWDTIKQQVNDLAAVLGPPGPGRDGVLARVLGSAADNLRGEGGRINQTVGSLSEAFTTLSQGRQDLFGSVRNLQVLVSALARNDTQVSQFNDQLARASGVLDDNREQLGTLLATLNRTSPAIEQFIRDNRGQLSSDLDSLKQVTTTLAENRQSLADVLHRAPTALSNLHNIYDPFNNSITTALADTNMNDPAQFACSTGLGVIPGGQNTTPAAQFCQTALRPLLDATRLPNFLPVAGDPLVRNGAPTPEPPPAEPTLPGLLLPGAGR